MTLSTQRLWEYPHLIDVASSFLSCGIMLCLALAPAVPGTVVIYLVAIFALLLSFLYLAAILLEVDTPSFHVCNLQFAVMTFGSALVCAIFYFITIWLCLNGIISTGSSAFYVCIIICIAATAAQVAKFAAHFLQWQRDQRANGFDGFPNSNYGSS